MEIFWTIKSIPELRNAPKRERSRRWQRAYHKTFRHISTWVALLLCALCGGIGAYYGQMAGSGVLGAMLGGGLGGFIFSQVSIVVARKHYQHILLGEESDRGTSPNA